jgi:hypothetical protein
MSRSGLSESQQQMVVGQLHASAALMPSKVPPVPKVRRVVLQTEVLRLLALSSTFRGTIVRHDLMQSYN